MSMYWVTPEKTNISERLDIETAGPRNAFRIQFKFITSGFPYQVNLRGDLRSGNHFTGSWRRNGSISGACFGNLMLSEDESVAVIIGKWMEEDTTYDWIVNFELPVLESDEALIAMIRDILWPEENADHEWDAETVEEVGRILTENGRGPKKKSKR
jgi:hypothetical protein